MPEEYQTMTGRRPDLEAIEVNPGIGYVGHKIYPVLNVMEKTGKIYYKTLTSDSAAQTGRSAGVAPTRTLLTDSNTDYTVAERIKRYGVTRSEVKQMGGIASADRLGGMGSKRSVQRSQEDAIIDKLFTGSATDISSAIINGLETAATSVRRYAGRMAFVSSESVYRWIIKQSEITAKLAYTFPTRNINEDTVLSVKTELFRAMLQAVIGFDEILIFDDDSEPTGKGDYAAVCKLTPPEEFSHKLDPVLGKTVQYLPDGMQPYEIESDYNWDIKVNDYDCSSWDVITELNAGAKYLCKGLDTAT